MRRIAWVLLLAFSFAIPWEYSLDLGAPLGNIARILGLLVLLAFIPAALQAGRMRAPTLLHWLALALYLWFCCSYFWSIEPAATLERMRGYAQVMMIVLFMWELTETTDDLRDLMRAYVAGAWVLAALTVANFAWPSAAGQIRFAAEGQDPNDVARFLDLSFPMAMLLLSVERRWWAKMLGLGYLPLGLLGVLLTASRGGLLAASVAVAGCGFLVVRAGRRILLGTSLALPAFAALLWWAVPRATIVRLASIPEQLSGGDLNQRLNIWTTGARVFAHAPIIGSGAGTFVTAARLAPIDTAHNTALSIAVDGGLVALTFAVAILFAGVRSVLRTRGPVRIALATALLVWMVTSLVATVETNRSTWFLLALTAVAARLSSHEPDAIRPAFDVRGSQALGCPKVEPSA